MRLIQLPLIAAAVITAGAAFAAPLQSIHAKNKMVQTMKGQPPKVILTETWIKNGKVRMKADKTISILDGKSQITYQPSDKQKRMMVLPLPANMKSKNTAALLKMAFTPPPSLKRKKVGTAKMLGHTTTIYDYSDGKTGQTMKVWIAQIGGAPVPLKQQMTDASGNSLTSQVTLLQINPKLSDTLFTTPKGFKPFTPPKQAVPPAKRP